MKYEYSNDDEDRDERSGDQPEKAETSLGLDQNVVAALTYVLGWLTGIAFLLIEKDNEFVRFHAIQSIAIFVPLTIASIVISALDIQIFLAMVPSALLNLAALFIWLLMMYQAFQGNKYKFPYAGDFAETQLKNMGSQ